MSRAKGPRSQSLLKNPIILAALIGLVGAISAALIAGAFALLAARWSSGNSGNHIPSSPAPTVMRHRNIHADRSFTQWPAGA
jgi:mannose/fructose/N-acetylgalactosamine-specific phosphotransferase system component IIC